MCHLTNLDADLNMPVDTNFSYYTLHDFHSNPDIFDCLSSNYAFSILNSNIVYGILEKDSVSIAEDLC